mgnify:CR=1 FL=1
MLLNDPTGHLTCVWFNSISWITDKFQIGDSIAVFGKVEFRNDDGGNVHAVVGKLSFEPKQLQDNIQTFINFIESLKPQVLKGTYLRGIAVCATMSPSIRIAA